jgi:hypothetical protein
MENVVRKTLELHHSHEYTTNPIVSLRKKKVASVANLILILAHGNE